MLANKCRYISRNRFCYMSLQEILDSMIRNQERIDPLLKKYNQTFFNRNNKGAELSFLATEVFLL